MIGAVLYLSCALTCFSADAMSMLYLRPLILVRLSPRPPVPTTIRARQAVVLGVAELH